MASDCEMYVFLRLVLTLYVSLASFSGDVQKKMSIFKDIIQIMVENPPSYPIFDKLFFDNF